MMIMSIVLSPLICIYRSYYFTAVKINFLISHSLVSYTTIQHIYYPSVDDCKLVNIPLYKSMYNQTYIKFQFKLSYIRQNLWSK